MAATTTRGRSPRRPPAAPLAAEIGEALAQADRGETEDLGSFAQYADDLVPVVAALIRTIQAALASAAADLGRGDMGANAALVRLGAHREDVETLRAFLAAQPRPAHIPPED